MPWWIWIVGGLILAGLEAVLSDPAKVEELKDELDSPLIGLAKWMPDSVVDWKLNSMFAKDEEKPEAPEVSAPEDKPTYSMPSLGT